MTRPRQIVFVSVLTQEQHLAGHRRRYLFQRGHALLVRRRKDVQGDTVKTLTFDRQADFWDALDHFARKRTTTRLVAANAPYAMTSLKFLDALLSRGWTPERLSLQEKSDIYLWRQRSPSEDELKGMTDLEKRAAKPHVLRTLKIVSCSNLFPNQVTPVGLEPEAHSATHKPRVESQGEKFERVKAEARTMWRLYRERIEMMDTEQWGNWKETPATQAMTNYRHSFMPYPIYITKDERLGSFSRACYFGGWHEAFRIGVYDEGPYYELDVNSLYPAAASFRSYPSKFLGVKVSPSLKWLKRKREHHAVQAICIVKTDRRLFPVHGVNGVIRPIETHRAYLSSRGIDYALAHSWIMKVELAAWFDEEVLFDGFIDYLYDRKVKAEEQGDKVGRREAKDQLARFHGVWGTKGRQARIVGDCDPNELYVEPCYDTVTGKSTTLIHIGGQILEVTKEGESWNSFPAIAGQWGEDARLYMHNLIEEAGRENVFHIAGDALLVNQQGLNNLKWKIHPISLGALKVKNVFANIIIRGTDNWSGDDTHRIAGIPRDAKPDADGGYPTRLKPTMRSLISQRLNYPYHDTIVKRHAKAPLKHGWVDRKGFVHPFLLTGNPDRDSIHVGLDTLDSFPLLHAYKQRVTELQAQLQAWTIEWKTAQRTLENEQPHLTPKAKAIGVTAKALTEAAQKTCKASEFKMQRTARRLFYLQDLMAQLENTYAPSNPSS